jgi:hypothetical protein
MVSILIHRADNRKVLQMMLVSGRKSDFHKIYICTVVCTRKMVVSNLNIQIKQDHHAVTHNYTCIANQNHSKQLTSDQKNMHTEIILIPVTTRVVQILAITVSSTIVTPKHIVVQYLQNLMVGRAHKPRCFELTHCSTQP